MAKRSPNQARSLALIEATATGGSRWFQLWIGAGLILALLLLVSSISTYVLVSRRMIVDQLRRDLAAQVAMMDQQLQQGSVQGSNQLLTVLQHTKDRSNGRIAWIHVQGGDGATIAQVGSRMQVFSNEDVHAGIRGRQPVFKSLRTTTGRVLVEVFPFRIPPQLMRVAVPEAPFPGNTPRQFSALEIGASLEGAGAPLWPLKRNLIINSSAALVLLISITVIALCLRSYVAGRQLEHEVQIARSVQHDLLPSSNRGPDGFKIAADWMPAARVSGDFYDTFSMRANQPAFVLGDVSGKGVPAALLMGVIHGAVRSSCWTESPLQHQESTRQMNRLLYERAATERFATMFWSYFDPEAQHLKYVNAGHCPPLLLKAGQRNTILRLCMGGPVLGLIADARFQQGSVRLEPGDVLVLYSDGIVEAANSADEEFGEGRLGAVLRGCSQMGAEEVRDRILASVEAFTGQAIPQDDRTLLVVVYSGAVARTAIIESQTDREVAICAA